jgi:hypothetical protein
MSIVALFVFLFLLMDMLEYCFLYPFISHSSICTCQLESLFELLLMLSFQFNSRCNRKTDQKFPVQTGFWTEFKPNLVEILSGRFLTSLGLAPVKFPV